MVTTDKNDNDNDKTTIATTAQSKSKPTKSRKTKKQNNDDWVKVSVVHLGDQDQSIQKKRRTRCCGRETQ